MCTNLALCLVLLYCCYLHVGACFRLDGVQVMHQGALPIESSSLALHDQLPRSTATTINLFSNLHA